MNIDQKTGSGTTVKRRSRRFRSLAVIVILPTALAACSDLLDVDIPGDVPAEALDDPRLAETLVQSTIGDFNCAFTNYAGATAALTDELQGATGWADYTDWDVRRMASSDGDLGSGECTNFGFGVYTPLQTARVQAEDNFDRIQSFDDADVTDKTAKLATLAAYAGYSYTVLGEGFCELAFDEGPIESPDDSFARAEEWFTDAIQLGQEAGAGTTVDLARVGLARTLLNLGRGEEAATVAEGVSDGLRVDIERSGTSERRWNRIARHTHDDFFYSVDPTFRDLEFEGTPDSRVVVTNANRTGHDGETPIFLPQKHTSVADPIRMASWVEAQLIIAEVRGGQEAVGIINALHDAAGLPSFASTDEEEIRAHVIQERSREFFLEGRRQWDLIRLGLPFPSGVNHKGQPIGDTTCFPLPDVERNNNPNISS